jgi:hypothetical protein
VQQHDKHSSKAAAACGESDTTCDGAAWRHLLCLDYAAAHLLHINSSFTSDVYMAEKFIMAETALWLLI